MKKFLLFLLLAALWAGPTWAQQLPVLTQPLPRLSTDASSTIAVTNTFQTLWGQQNGPPNSGTGALRAACSIQNNGANNMWVYAGAATPVKTSAIVVAPGAIYQCGSNEVVGTSLIAITGTSGDAFTALLDGAPTVAGPPQATSGGGSDVTIVGPLGQATKAASLAVTLASDQGALVVSTSDPCTSAAKSSAPIAVATATTTSLVAVSGSTTVYVCGFAMTIAPSAVSAATALLEYGTGATCTSPTALTGTFGNGDLTSAAGVAPILYGNGSATVTKGAASAGICILTAGNAVSVQGVLTYVQQ